MNEIKPLPRSFYEPSARVVAERLLGHWLFRDTPAGPCGGVIVETEAYVRGDAACHGAPGPTARNQVMFGEPGHAYVYFIYGCHYCFNAVCEPVGVAEAVLIRAVEPTLGVEQMLSNRPVQQARSLTNGPAKLCAAMRIDGALNGVDLCSPDSPIFIGENPHWKRFRRRHGPRVVTTRIGITRSAELPLRFYLRGSTFVSRKAG